MRPTAGGGHMKKRAIVALMVGAVAFGGATASAAPDKDHSPGPKSGKAEKRKAYGKYCQGQSKKHVKGEKGTPFSQCVRAMAKLDKGKADNPAKACKGLSKKHVKGKKKTPYSKCVSGAKRLIRDTAEG
jgi:hypothetical protein